MHRLRTPRLALSLLVGALALLCTAPSAALAAPGAEVGMEDERLMLSEPSRAPETVDQWAAAGVDVVRLHARWYAIAPNQHSKRRPRGFNPSSPNTRRYDFATLDRAIALVRSRGMKVMLSVTGPAPLWATRNPARGNQRYEPDPKAYAQFARAVALRYGDRVDRYLVWNEPNQSGWLQPQSTCTGRRGARTCVARAPHLYRSLVRAAVPAIKRADPGAQVLLGELQPVGGKPTAPAVAIRPLRFLRELACVDARYRPIRGGRCKGFKPAAAAAFGYHPHGVKNAPQQANRNRDSAQIADLRRLERVLDRLTRRGRIASPGRRPFDLYLTEFSYQTSPPDRATGISLSRQAIYAQQAAYIAWRDPRVRNLTQYQWDDEYVTDRGPGSKRYSGWQGGLRFLDGRPKPAFAAFGAPFVVDVAKSGRVARLWGQVRPGGAHTVTLFRGPESGDDLSPIAVIRTGDDGTWTLPVPLTTPGRYRAEWEDGRSGVVTARPRDRGKLLAVVP